MNLLSVILNIYIWTVVAILLYFLFAIARFYQKKSGQRSYYAAFLVVAVFFGGSALRYALLPPAISGDVWGDSLRFAGAIILVGFGYFLLRLMTGGRS